MILRSLAISFLFAAAAATAAPGPAAVDAERLLHAEGDAGNWITHGRTTGEQRFSPLAQIDAGNVGRLGIAWMQTLDSERGVQATPLVIDGVLYTTSAWSVVYAFDAATGKPLWKHDPQVNRGMAGDSCCGVVNRGVAAWKGRIYAATLDGRLQALDARDGRVLWSVQTFIDASRPYSITGAPRIVKGRVLIGNGGAEMGVRGYVSAYDADTGALAWRFFTVPGDPAKPESPAMAMAAKTWSGNRWQEWGGGGTVWDAMSWDPELDLLYIGVGNGGAWSRSLRSPGGGDNLFLSSIVALRPDTGEYVWHFQLAPGEQWDYPATTQLVLIDAVFQGKPRKLLVQAPKHGFVYVLDRVTGKLLSAEKFTRVTWASGYDLATGRPIETPEADYSRSDTPVLLYPGMLGGHTWNPLSYSPLTGYLYFSELQYPGIYAVEKGVRYREGGRRLNMGQDSLAMIGSPALMAEAARNTRGSITAWDVANARIAWRVDQPIALNGGTLATAGNLVFHGATDGRLVAYAADSGSTLWEAKTFGAIPGGPVSYAVAGRQYVVAGIGWGGGIAGAFADGGTRAGLRNPSRLVAWTLDAKGTLPPPPPLAAQPGPPPATAPLERVMRGAALYATHCGYCHGAGSGGVPDLALMSAQTHAEFLAIVRGGLRRDKGMPGFAEQLDDDAARAIHDFLIAQANQRKAAAPAAR